MQATFSRATAARARALEELRLLLQNELRVGLTMAERALRAQDEKRTERLTAMARQAYESILRLTLRLKLSEAQPPKFGKDLDALKSSLLKLGERF